LKRVHGLAHQWHILWRGILALYPGPRACPYLHSGSFTFGRAILFLQPSPNQAWLKPSIRTLKNWKNANPL
jgi:hypothetical protein